MLGALGARGAYAQGDPNMGGTSPPDQEKLPQKHQTPLPEQAPDRSTMKSDQDKVDKSNDQAKASDQAKATEQEKITDQTGKTIEAADVLFAFDSAQLAADASSKLQPIADWAKCNPKGAVIIEGHADPRGTADYNQKLSAQRAAAVREKLVDLGVPSARIVMSVYGKQGPRRATFAEDRRATVRPALTPVEAREVTAQR
jgi:outer membrane protein OmpA-like peptidoglycan-associated protein